ncbi:MAG TPA: hypothetical protein VGN44_09670 [Candidatus Angelobacter sp.]
MIDFVRLKGDNNKVQSPRGVPGSAWIVNSKTLWTNLLAVREEILDFISYQRDSSAPVKGPNGGIPDEFQIHELPPEEYKKIIDKLNDMTGPDWDYIHLRPVTKPDWEKWAQAAGFDLWEQQVLNFKTARISRERALKQQPDEISRKALQAAWKRFDRGGMNRLRAAAKKNSTKNVPEP